MSAGEELLNIMEHTTFPTSIDLRYLRNNSNTSGNSTDGGDVPVSTYNEKLARIEVTILGILLYLAIFGNSVVLLVLKCRRTKLTRMQWFIVHLCLADLSVAFFNILPQLVWDITYKFHGNNFLCKLIKYLQVMAMYSSSYVLVVTALDRYISICYPLTSHTWTMRRVHIMVMMAWLLAFLFASPQLFLFSYVETVPGSGVYNCWESMTTTELKVYITWNCISVYVIPFIILTVAYSKICCVVWVSVDAKEQSNRRAKSSKSIRVSFRKNCLVNEKQESQTQFLRNPRAHTKSASKSKIKTIKLTLVVVSCYLICWAPFYIAQTWWVYDPSAPFTGDVFVMILLLANLNSCANPWIFLAFSGKMCSKRKHTVSRSSAGTINTYMDSDTRNRSSYSGGRDYVPTKMDIEET